MRRVLFDENTQFSIRTVQEEQWAGFENGELLGRASGRFDVLLTVDQRLRYQQNLSRFAIGVVVIETIDTTRPNLRTLLGEIERAISEVTPGTVIVIRPK